jgi:hypothetical protein
VRAIGIPQRYLACLFDGGLLEKVGYGLYRGANAAA